MSSREYWGPGHPPRRPAPGWEQYDRPIPPRDEYFNLPPPPRPPPPPFYEDSVWHQDERPPPPPLPPINRPPLRGAFRGRRGKGEGSVGRGSWNNGPKTSPRNDVGKKSNASMGGNNSTTGKPAWLAQSSNEEKTTVSDMSSDKKPAWLNQSPSQSNTNTTSTTNATKTTDSQPAWLKDASKPSSENKPAWLSQPVNQSKTGSNNTGNMPAWLSAPVANNNSTTTSTPPTMPAWLRSSTNSNQASAVIDTTRSDSPPPPPPPSHPPPKNQPKFHPVPTPPTPLSSKQVFPMSTSVPQTTKQMNKAKNKALAEVKVPAPGEPNFISFKNSLQEFSQKKGLHVPAYHTFKNSYGQSARVEAAQKTFQSSGIYKDKKEAEQNAAYEALKALGLLAATVPFTSTGSTKTGTKRAQPTPQTVAKKLKGEIPTLNNSPNFKCQLNEFCQKFHLPVPTYETAHDANGYVTTLVYNKKVYLSTSPQSSKKAAEQNVAQLVLSKVNQAPPPMDQNQKMILQNFAAASSATPEPGVATTTSEAPKQESISLSSVQDLAAKNITPMISYKNKLQEVCQKKKTFLPVYDTVKEGNVYNCKVAIDGKVFNATGCKTKKGAEQSAARVALQALGLLTE